MNCIIVGCSKCGTTYLMNLLRNHPSIEMCLDELHYFDLNYHDKNYYNSHMNFSKKNKIFMEKSPSYCFLPQCLERIYEYNKDIKIIFCIRNHVDRITSHIHMNMVRRDEVRNINDILETELSDMNSIITYESSQYMYIRRSMYYGQLKRCYEIFPKENIFVFNLDNYNLTGLYKFIGVEVLEINDSEIFKRVGRKDRENILLKNDISNAILKHKKLMDLINNDKQQLQEEFNIIV